MGSMQTLTVTQHHHNTATTTALRTNYGTVYYRGGAQYALLHPGADATGGHGRTLQGRNAHPVALPAY